MAEDRITAALRGPQPAPTASDDQGDPGDGSAQSGYRTPDKGPCECENCIHFEEPNRCNHPQVVNDPEVQGQVDTEGWCNFFQSAHRETQEQEHAEGESENEE